MEEFANGHALLIGVGRTRHTVWSLPVTVADARALEAVLIDPARCGYPADQVQFLHDEAATRSGIETALGTLATRVGGDPEATVVVYYSGHGWLSGDRYYLIPHDIDAAHPADTALPATAFTDLLRRITAERLLVILDCCHAAGQASAKADELPAGFAKAAVPKDVMEGLKTGRGRAVFSSSQGSEQSWIRRDGTLSIYTYHLLEVLSGQVPIGDELVKLSHIMSHVSKSVMQTALAEHGQPQTPVFDMAAENFPVARFSGGKAPAHVGITAPEIHAHFVLDGDKPDSGQDDAGRQIYEIVLSIANAPADARLVTYDLTSAEFESEEMQVVKVRNRPTFMYQLPSYGDFDIPVTISLAGKQKLALAATLSDALARYYERHSSTPAIVKALNRIKNN